MKKFLPFVVVLLAACAAPPTNKETTTIPGNMNASPESSQAMAVPSDADVIAREKSIWDTIKNKDYTAFSNMLANDQVEVSEMGVNDKAGSVAGIKKFEPTESTFSDWKVLPVDNDAVVVTYTAAVKGKMDGKDFPPANMRCSSAWVNRDGKWLAIYHQESTVMTEPMTPAAKASPAKAAASPAKAAASPMMKEMGTTTSDGIANEKMVWDALKSRNYDGFAALLDPRSLEVESSGVYDKDGSVKNVANYDFSKSELSDFKALNIDKDAMLVTYMVKMPGMKPENERHSTIWVNRDGKWRALFHQGTLVTGKM